MTGALVIAFVIVIVLPVGFLMGGAILSAIMSLSLYKDAEATHEGSEYVDLNV